MAVQIHELLTFAVENRASDIHLAAGEIPCVRIDGEIRRLQLAALLPDEAKRMAYSVMNEKQKTHFEKNLEIDFSIGLKGLARFRVLDKLEVITLGNGHQAPGILSSII